MLLLFLIHHQLPRRRHQSWHTRHLVQEILLWFSWQRMRGDNSSYMSSKFRIDERWKLSVRSISICPENNKVDNVNFIKHRDYIILQNTYLPIRNIVFFWQPRSFPAIKAHHRCPQDIRVKAYSTESFMLGHAFYFWKRKRLYQNSTKEKLNTSRESE